MYKKVSLIFSAVLFASLCTAQQPEKIDRYALVERNSPKITAISEMSSLSVGNGNFAFTVDATGLQTFPELYSAGVPLGTQSQWGWHSFPNTHHYKPEETLKNYNFRGRDELYSVPFNEEGRQRDAAEYLRVNPHRMHLGYIGLEHANGRLRSEQISRVDQKLELWNGEIKSSFLIEKTPVTVRTAVHPRYDEVAATIGSPLLEKGKLSISFRFPYPSGKHADDASDWTLPEKHLTQVISNKTGSVVFKRTVDTTVYYVTVRYKGKASLSEKEPHYFVLTPQSREFSFTSEFTEELPAQNHGAAKETFTASSSYWQAFWTKGGAVDFSKCTDVRAKELERRVILSQYLLAIQSAGKYPPQETGLTYNSWFGKFHLEMHWWHSANFALWNHAELLERSLGWYNQAAPVATEIARRQGFEGLRWMKMTDPSGTEAPSKVGSFLIWQQPHFIYMAELVYRSNPSPEVIRKYGQLVDQTAKFMASFATYDEAKGRYVLKGAIPAQETLRASEAINPPFELSYWHYALSVAQQWKERAGEKREPHWDEMIAKLSPLAAADGLYLASEDALDTYKDIRFTSDHPAILGALGILPQNRLINPDYMKNSLNWIWDNWNWPKTWGWDYPMTAMAAARLGDPEKAVGALLMDQQKNTYLVNGHNYQDARLRVYLPGNGGLLTAIAMMCAGWDGNETKNPGFPKDGKWNVRWENLQPMP